MTVCPECLVSYVVYREQELLKRSGCFRHRTEAPLPDPDMVTRLRREWASVSPHPLLSISRADLRDDQRAEAVRRREEASEAWRSAPDPEPTTAEDRLLAAFDLPELVAEAA